MNHPLEFPFTEDFRTTPWWWEAAPPEPSAAPASLPERVDALVIGAGLTGLNAAITLAGAGRKTLVLDACALGAGASTMNAGFLGRTLKHSFGALLARDGADTARQAYDEAERALRFVFEMVERHRIHCYLKRCGRYIAARDATQLAQMRAEYDLRDEHLGAHYRLLPPERAQEELGSPTYPGGGVVLPDLGSLHPALYHHGLLQAARHAGAVVHGDCPVLAVRAESGGQTVATPAGNVRASQVLVATNGYTDARLPWFKRRVVPFRGYMIATEPLPTETLEQLIPADRTVHDWQHNLAFMRRAPDDPRLLLGWRTGVSGELTGIAEDLHGKLVSVFPGLADTRISHAWTGYCAGTFDQMPHVGWHEGLHYALGWCFAGVPMGSWLGHVAARRMLGETVPTAFDRYPLKGRFWYSGTPWFLPAYLRWLDWQDRRSQ